MKFTTEEKLRLLEGETESAKALVKAFKAALDHKLMNEETVQHELNHLIESWFALREQRIMAQDAEDPSHIIN